MNDEKLYYERYLNNSVRIIRDVNGKDYVYSGVVIAILESKLVLNDIKSGQMMISYDEIKVIEYYNQNNVKG